MEHVVNYQIFDFLNLSNLLNIYIYYVMEINNNHIIFNIIFDIDFFKHERKI